MTIDRINPLEPLQPGKKTGRSNEVSRTKERDSIQFSPEAVEQAERYRASELVSAVDDALSVEQVAAYRKKMNDPSYFNDKLIRATADRIADFLLQR